MPAAVHGRDGQVGQFLLHTWLPDAMEGPTPVSALIHAATMVTAGVFMVARLSPLFELAPIALAVVIFIGATTAFFAATVGLVQNDIKRVVAYSTCSQLGYMFVALGVAPIGRHLPSVHPRLFKALLFLGSARSSTRCTRAGHAQDGRPVRKIPFTYCMMVIGTLALTGFPFTAGYFSKDAIMRRPTPRTIRWRSTRFMLTVIAAGLTSFYSWRLIFMTFFGAAARPGSTTRRAHESRSDNARFRSRALAAGIARFAGCARSRHCFAGRRRGVLARIAEDAVRHILEAMESRSRWFRLSADRR